MATRTGQLDQRITFEAKEKTDIGGGNSETEWVVSDVRWARVVPISGRERFQAQQIENPTSYEIHIRYPRGTWKPDNAMRIKWRGQTMGIRTIHWAGPKEAYLQIDCEAGVSAEQ